MKTATPQETDAVLDAATLNQMLFKPGVTTNICVMIVQHLLADRICWGDQIPLPVVADDSRNCIGLAFRILGRRKIIHRMADCRRSKIKTRRGGVVFKYRIGNDALARAFLKNNGVTVFRRSLEELPL